MEVAIIVPLIVFASIVLVVATPFYFKYRNQRILFDAIRTTVEKTGSADPALISAITAGNIGPNADLRRGVLLIAAAAGLVVMAALNSGDPGAAWVFGLAAFPGLIGAAYIGLHFFAPREPTV